MNVIKDGVSANRKIGRSRPILTLRRDRGGSESTAQLGGNEQLHTSAERVELQPGATAAERFEAALWAARNVWDIRRRALPTDADGWLRGGALAGLGRIDKMQADKLWTQAKAAFAGAGAR